MEGKFKDGQKNNLQMIHEMKNVNWKILRVRRWKSSKFKNQNKKSIVNTEQSTIPEQMIYKIFS